MFNDDVGEIGIDDNFSSGGESASIEDDGSDSSESDYDIPKPSEIKF